VRVVLSGAAPSGGDRPARLGALVEAAVGPGHAVQAAYSHLVDDTYDKDGVRGSASSYAGPNAAFYGLMLGGGGAGGGTNSTTTTTSTTPGLCPPEAGPGERSTPAAGRPPSASPPTHYTFALFLESDVCALRAGWLDVALAPLLHKAAFLISGSRAKVACVANPAAPGQPCASTPGAAWPRHARHHINGGAAAYRLSPDLTSLLAAARDQFEGTVPYDVAAWLVGSALGLAHALHDAPRVVSVVSPVDGGRFADAAYYGPATRAALVHAPRRLRVPAAAAVAARLGRPATVAILPDVAGLPTLVHGLHLSLIRGGADRGGLAYVALSRAGFEEASDRAPQRVLGSYGDDGAAPPAAAALRAVASLARHGVRVALVVGADAAAVRLYTPATKALAGLAVGGGGGGGGGHNASLLVGAGPGSPMTPGAGPGGVLQVGVFLIAAATSAGSDAVATGLEAWADALSRGPPPPAAGLKPPPSPSPPPPPPPPLDLRSLLPPALHVSTLPPDLFPSGPAFFGPAWPRGGARARAPLLISGLAAGVAAPDTTPFAWSEAAARRARQARLWRAGPGAACATYAAIGRAPMLVTDLASVHAALSRTARFLVFVAARRVDCAVLPGFVVGGPGGPLLPWDALLDAGAVTDLAGGRTVFYGHARDLGAPAAGLVWFDPSAGGGAAEGAAGAGSAHAQPPPPPSLCAAHFGLPGSSCFAAPLAAAVDLAVHELVGRVTAAAASAAPAPPLVCTRDSWGTTPAELAVAGLEGGLGRLGARLAAAAGPSPAFLTGPAWRAVSRRLKAGVHVTNTSASPPPFLSLADLPPPPPALSDPLLSSIAPDDAPPLHPAWAGWAPLIEAAVCQAAAGAGAPPPLDVGGLLEGANHHRHPPLTTPAASLLPRLALFIPPHVLDADLTALDAWLKRPDRPGLAGGRTARAVVREGGGRNSAPPAASSSAMPHHAALALLSLAPLVGAARSVLPAAPADAHGRPRSWADAVGPAGARSIYGAFPNALPPSVGLLLDPAAAADADAGGGPSSPSSSFLPLTRSPHPASTAVLASPRHGRAVAAIRRVLEEEEEEARGCGRGQGRGRGPGPVPTVSRFLVSAAAPTPLLSRAGDLLPRGRGGGGGTCDPPVSIAFDLSDADLAAARPGTGAALKAWLAALHAEEGVRGGRGGLGSGGGAAAAAAV